MALDRATHSTWDGFSFSYANKNSWKKVWRKNGSYSELFCDRNIVSAARQNKIFRRILKMAVSVYWYTHMCTHRKYPFSNAKSTWAVMVQHSEEKEIVPINFHLCSFYVSHDTDLHLWYACILVLSCYVAHPGLELENCEILPHPVQACAWCWVLCMKYSESKISIGSNDYKRVVDIITCYKWRISENRRNWTHLSRSHVPGGSSGSIGDAPF